MENISLNSNGCAQDNLQIRTKAQLAKVPMVNLETKPDSFESSEKEPELINIDPNDTYTQENPETANNTQKNFIGSAKLGASINPTQIIKWGGRLWAAAEIYDTLDGYYERFKNMIDKKKENNI